MDRIVQAAEENCMQGIIVRGEGIDEDGDRIISKGLCAGFDTMADVNLIDVVSLRRLGKDFTRLEDMPSEQQRQLQMVHVEGSFVALGTVPLEWWLMTFLVLFFSCVSSSLSGVHLSSRISLSANASSMPSMKRSGGSK